MKNIVLICLVLISNILFGQSNPNVFEDWRTTTGVQAFFHKSVTKTDVNNNVYVAGATLNGSGNYDVLVAKYDVNGIQQWIHQINGAADDQDFATALALDNNSNVYITGAITDSITNLSDILTIKYNSNGVLQWMKRYDSSDNLYDSGTDLIVDDGGVVYVTGSVQNANADMDFVTLAYKPSGTLIWASQYNSMYGLNDAGVKINFGKNQNQVCVVGVCQINPTKYIAAVLKYKNNGTLLDSVFTNTNSTEINMVHGFTRDSFGNLYFAGIYDAVGEGKNIDVVKLDTALNIEWEITADYSTLDDEAKSIAVDLLGNVYVGGYFTTTTQGKDAFIRQYDGYGNMNWEKVYDSGMNLDDEINAIVVDGQNNVIISGYATKQNNVDYYTAKYDINGNKKWEIFSDGGYNLEDKITNTAIDELGGVIVTGMSKINSNNYKYTTIRYIENLNHPLPSELGLTYYNGRPSHLKSAVLVRFNPDYLYMDKIDNRYLHCSYAATFIKDTVISLLAEKLFTGTPAERINKMKKIKTKKVFPFMASADSISVTRSGEKIGVPIFWATLQFYFTEGTDELVVCDSINTIYPYVYYVHPNYIGQFETSANDSLYNLQASLSPTTQYSNGDINVEEAWEVETGKSHVKVGVFDTGIDSLHPDIDVFKRIDIETAMLDVLGSHGVGGHGTSVAGIIGAKRDNYSGIAGIAGGQGNNGSGCKLYDFDEGDDNDGILLEGAVSGIVVGAAQWYYNNSTFSNDVPASIGQGLNVINASWVAHLYQDQINDSSSISWPPDPYECKLCYEAIEFAFRNEVVVSAARGNYPHTNPTNFDQTFYLYPACVKDEFVLNVGSSGYDGEHKIWGNGLQTPSDGYESMYGKGVDVIAPGTLATVYTTKSQTVTPNNSLYKSFNGTSAAAPHVAGVAALMLSHVNTPCPSKKNLAPEDVEYILQKTADDKETFGYNEKSGWGHLNAGKALKAIQEPQYQIIHIDNIPSSINTTFFDTASVYIRNPYEGTSGPYSSGLGIISDGEYYIDIYKTTATVNHLMNLSHLSSSTQIIDKWVRNSSSIGWALNRNVMLAQGWRKDTIDVTTNVFLDTSSFNTTSSTLTAYNYFVKCSVDSTIVVNQWYPRPASQCRFEYSIYVFDSLAVSVPTYPCDSSVDIYEPVLENVNNLNIICAYPNPFVNNFTIEYYSPYDENCYIYVTDLLGRTVTSVAVASIKKGNYKINLDLSNISNGVYFVILSTKENRVYKKILKVN